MVFFSLNSELDVGVLADKTSETISDSAECYAGPSVSFESSAACMLLVSSRPYCGVLCSF